jgi:hypothetical protein
VASGKAEGAGESPDFRVRPPPAWPDFWLAAWQGPWGEAWRRLPIVQPQWMLQWWTGLATTFIERSGTHSLALMTPADPARGPAGALRPSCIGPADLQVPVAAPIALDGASAAPVPVGGGRRSGRSPAAAERPAGRRPGRKNGQGREQRSQLA